MTVGQGDRADTPIAPPIPIQATRGRLIRVLARRQYTLTVVTVGLFTFFSLFAAHFLSLANVYDMLRVISYTLIVAVPMTYLFIAGELDLSVGSNVALSSVIMAILVTGAGADPWVAGAVALIVGAVVGATNGFIVTVIGVPSFIVTLGMLSLLRGLSLVITGATPVVFPDDVQGSFFFAVNGHIAILGDLPTQVVWGLGIFLIGAAVLRFTGFGYHVYATGGNPKASRASGISTRGVKFSCFVLTGAACGLLGALEGGWLREGNPTAAAGFELQVIAALIIGGITLTGGAGSVYGTLLGAGIVGMLNNGLVLIGVPGDWNGFFVGLLIVVVSSAEVGLKRSDEIRRFFRIAGLALVRRGSRSKGRGGEPDKT
jgi:ribose transport system permease protein